MFVIAFLFHLIVIAAGSSVVILLLHYKKNFSLPSDNPWMIIAVFVSIIVTLGMISTLIFVYIPWSTLVDSYLS